MTQETIYAELKKLHMQFIQHVTKAIQQPTPVSQFMVLTDHHLGLALYYFTQKLKKDEVPESGELSDQEGKEVHTAINDATRSNDEHQANS